MIPMPLLAIIATCGIPVNEWVWFYQALFGVHEQISSMNNVRVDDWTAELVIIATNNDSLNELHVKIITL